MFNLKDSQQKDRVGAVALDSAIGILYVTEPLAEGDKTIIHMWKLNDDLPPRVMNVNPINDEVNVARDKVISVFFSEPIKVGNMWIELYNTIGKKTLTPITTLVSGNVLTINHTPLLTPGTQYTLCLHTGSITDNAGNPLALCSFSFTT